jgi:hypothetical protein
VREPEPRTLPCYRASSAAHHIRSCDYLRTTQPCQYANVPTEEQEPDASTILPRTTNKTIIAPIRLLSRLDNDRTNTPAIYQLNNRSSSIFDHYHHLTLVPYYYPNRLLAALPAAKPNDPYCSAHSNNWNRSNTREDNNSRLS